MTTATACKPIQLGVCLPVGAQRTLRVNFTRQLKSALLSGTPAVVEVGAPPTVQITLKNVNTAPLTLNNGEEYPAGTIVLARIRVIRSKVSPTRLKIFCNTTDGWDTVEEEVEFQTRP